MQIYGVYEADEYEECVFVGTAKEVSEEFKVKIDTVRREACSKNKFKSKYKIISLYWENNKKIVKMNMM